MVIRPERPGDAEAIRALTEAAFKGVAHSDETEAQIVDALRAAGALTLSLVAVAADEILGHAAFSPVRINGLEGDWHGLGPVSVWPARQGQGVGQALIREGLRRLKALGSAGCVVLGEPAYYGRFGFAYDPGLFYGQAPPGYFQRLTLRGADPKGEVTYHPGFDAA
jgi:putative acetyltransferase